MDPSQSPYELQFSWLLKLPYQDILNYCQTSRQANRVCQSDYFWNEKALLEYKIPLEVIASGSGMVKYRTLTEYYEKYPEKLIAPVLSLHNYQIVPKLVEKTYELNDRHDYFALIADVIKDTYRLGHDQLQFLIETVERISGLDNKNIYDVFRLLYYRSISEQRADMKQLLSRFYNYRTDPNIEVEYYRAMKNGDLEIVKHLDQDMKDMLGSEYEQVGVAIDLMNPETVNYFRSLYPYVFEDEVFIGDLKKRYSQYYNDARLEFMNNQGI